MVVFFGSRLPKIPMPARLESVLSRRCAMSLLDSTSRLVARQIGPSKPSCKEDHPSTSPVAVAPHPPWFRCAACHPAHSHGSMEAVLRIWPDLAKLFHVLQMHQHAKMAKIFRCHDIPEN